MPTSRGGELQRRTIDKEEDTGDHLVALKGGAVGHRNGLLCIRILMLLEIAKIDIVRRTLIVNDSQGKGSHKE